MSASEACRLANHKVLQEYIHYYESLSPRTLPLLDGLAEPGMTFQDPFNTVRGVDAVMRIFEHMFQSVETPKFRVLDYGWSETGQGAYIKWVFRYGIKGLFREIQGMSEVTFSPSGKIASHTDYWDAATYFYEHIPILGSAIRWVKSKMRV